ncbi:MAG: hypothetical protein KatS3mg129_1306 [Leptospiraceae bacterium]|nr:MAG: hypothetical protein KatS3mg129_1306 [Leptospiraceae bacterium]
MGCIIWFFIAIIAMVAISFMAQAIGYLIGLAAIAFICFLVGYIIGAIISAIFN